MNPLARISRLLPAIVMSVGCSSGGNLMPSEPGTKWTYEVRTGFGAGHVEDVEVSRRLSVANSEGFELNGALGGSRLAWREGALWADRLPNVRFIPPIPILRQDLEPTAWTGKIETPFGQESATAKLRHSEVEKTIGGRKFKAVRSELQVERNVGLTTLSTWFAPDTGIVLQEQHTGGALDLRLTWVSGPTRQSTR